MIRIFKAFKTVQIAKNVKNSKGPRTAKKCRKSQNYTIMTLKKDKNNAVAFTGQSNNFIEATVTIQKLP